jgi:predicted Zn-dependent peptidase
MTSAVPASRVASGAGSARTTVAPASPTMHTSVTDAGIRVVSETIPHTVGATIGMWVSVGSRDEDADTAGCSHLLEHMLFRGTRRHSGRELADRVERVGGTLNAFTTQEETCYWARTLGEDTGVAFDVLADMMCDATNTAADLDVERPVVLAEISAAADDPDHLSHAASMRSRFGHHPLTRPILGPAAGVATMGRDTLHRHFGDWYRPETLVVAGAGALEHGELVSLADTLLGDLGRPGAPERPQRVAPSVSDDDVVCVEHPGEQTHVTVSVATFGAEDDAAPTLAVLATLLGGGMSSRLFQQVREVHALAYTTYAHISTFAEVGLLSLYAATSPAQASATALLLQQELEALAGSVTAVEVDDARRRLLASRRLAAESSGDRMRYLGARTVAGLPLRSQAETAARFDAVDVAAVRQLGAELAAAPRSVVTVGAPPSGSGSLLLR